MTTDDIFANNVNNDETLQQKIDDCTSAIISGVEKELDKKTLAFLTLSEFVHAYGNNDNKELYKNFENDLTQQEFKDTIIYNTALMNGDIEDIFEQVEEKGFEEVGLSDIVKNLDNEYNQIGNEIEDQLEEKEKEKKAEIKQPGKNVNFTEIGM